MDAFSAHYGGPGQLAVVQELMDLRPPQRLPGEDRLVQLAPLEQSSITNMEVWFQALLPFGSSTGERQPPEDARRDWSAVVCFSCGTPGHGTSRCPTLDVTFPFLPPRWQAEQVGSGFAMWSPRILADRLQVENVN